MRAHINVSSKQIMHRLTKISNTQTAFTHIVMHIILEIFLTEDLSPQHINYSTVTPLTGVSGNNPRHTESGTMQKQDQCTQEF